jgi:hypothetical protein
MSRILNRQRQLAEQGRLRLGLTTTASSGKARPKASATWIVTSHSQEHVEAAAALWGGTVERWQPMGNCAEQWRVISEAYAVDAILPPGEPLMQAYELWSKGGCQRRCDGVTEQFTGAPCICAAKFGEQWHEQPNGTVCDTKSRLKVILPDMPGMGSWRVETGSYYAADAMAGLIDVIRGTVGEQTLIPIRLRIEPRTRIAGGQTKQFVVPVLELRGVTAGELLGGTFQGIRSVEAAKEQRAIGAGSEDLKAVAELYLERARQCTDLDGVSKLWHEAKESGHLTNWLEGELRTIANAITPAQPDVEADPDTVWQQILTVSGEQGRELQSVLDEFPSVTGGVTADDASGADMQRYLEYLKAAKV